MLQLKRTPNATMRVQHPAHHNQKKCLFSSQPERSHPNHNLRTFYHNQRGAKLPQEGATLPKLERSLQTRAREELTHHKQWTLTATRVEPHATTREYPPAHCTQGPASTSLLLLLLQSCPTLYNPTDSSPPGSPIPGILQARILEWPYRMSLGVFFPLQFLGTISEEQVLALL